jgi:uncharacterized protein (TIGR00369 family)
MDLAAVQQVLSTVLAPWVRELNMTPEQVDETSVKLRLPFSPALRHIGGVVCGQVFMAAADTAMVAAVSVALGGYRPMTTVTLNTSFMKSVKVGDLHVVGRVLRQGKNLIFGEIELFDAEGRLAAHATVTYALLS